MPALAGAGGSSMLVRPGCRISGSEEVLARASFCCNAKARDLDVLADRLLPGRSLCVCCVLSVLRGFRGVDLGCRRVSVSECPCWFAFRLVLTDPPATVWLLVIFCACPASEIVSSVGLGLLPCAIANGPAHLDSAGTATAARMRLESTVTGNTFSLIFSLCNPSLAPNTILCTLL
jgi:hypothetical protein